MTITSSLRFLYIFGGSGLLCGVQTQKLAKLNWDSQLGKLFSLPSQRNFPISFKPKVAIAEFFWKMQRKTWYSIFGLDTMPLSLKNLLLIDSLIHTVKVPI